MNFPYTICFLGVFIYVIFECLKSVLIALYQNIKLQVICDWLGVSDLFLSKLNDNK